MLMLRHTGWENISEYIQEFPHHLPEVPKKTSWGTYNDLADAKYDRKQEPHLNGQKKKKKKKKKRKTQRIKHKTAGCLNQFYLHESLGLYSDAAPNYKH